MTKQGERSPPFRFDMQGIISKNYGHGQVCHHCSPRALCLPRVANARTFRRRARGAVALHDGMAMALTVAPQSAAARAWAPSQCGKEGKNAEQESREPPIPALRMPYGGAM
eukprot:3284330-Pleurochrysis_carterae.AAC.1